MLRKTKTVAEAGRSTAGWWTEMTKAGEAQIRVERTYVGLGGKFKGRLLVSGGIDLGQWRG